MPVMPKEWETYMARMEREIALRPSDAPKKQKSTGRLQSPRMRRVSTQTRNAVKAIYQEPSAFNQAIVAPDTEIDGKPKLWTWNVGGSCEPDRPHGKSTESRGGRLQDGR